MYYYIILLYHYHTHGYTIIQIISVFCTPCNIQEPADANSRPMLPAMTDKSPAASAKLQDDQANLLYEAKSTYSAQQRLLYVLFLVLYLLFWISVQDLAACNLDLRTASRNTTNLWGHTTNLCEASCHWIKRKILLAVALALFMPFSFVLYALIQFYSLLYVLFQNRKQHFSVF